MSEGADKVGVVGEAGKLARLLHADPLLQQLPGHKHPTVDDILHHGEAGGRLEDAAQIVLFIISFLLFTTIAGNIPNLMLLLSR